MKSVGARPVDVQLIRSILSDYAPDERELAEHWLAGARGHIDQMEDVVKKAAARGDDYIHEHFGMLVSRQRMIIRMTEEFNTFNKAQKFRNPVLDSQRRLSLPKWRRSGRKPMDGST